ncbi:MAG: hypothetical protein LQ350_006032 [Teloschistes chrysophthalmus]|nr:MAG: hypothetical protein LQ350_006032 [Niorma chrysophthalma]
MFSLTSREVGLEGRGVELFYTAIIFPSIALATVLARFACVDHGVGKHISTLTPNDKHQSLFAFYLSQTLYKLTIALTKTSILLLYLRIFPLRTPPLHTYRLLTHATIAFVLSYTSASIITTIFQCAPVARAWDREIEGSCVDLTAFWFVNAVVNMGGDLVIFALPVPIVWKLQMGRGEKWGLLPIFGLGVFVITTSTLRTTTLPLASKTPDPTHDTMLSTLWSNVEANTGILCACLPTLKKPLANLYRHRIPPFLGGNNNTRTNPAAGVDPFGNTTWMIRSAESSRTMMPLGRPSRGEEHQQQQQGSTHSTDAGEEYRSASSASSAARKEDGSVVHLV